MSLTRTLRGAWSAGRIATAAAAIAMASDAQGRQRAKAHLAEVLGQLRGLPNKVGQWLALTPGDDTFAANADGLEPLPWPVIRERLGAEWGCDPMSHLSLIDPVGRAASLGQVHRARRHDGREVAVKVRYPGIETAIDESLSTLGLIPAAGPMRRAGLDLDAHVAVIRATLEGELDYRQEADRQELARLAAGPTLVVPAVHRDLSTAAVLVQDWEEGETLASAAAAWPVGAREAAAAALVARFLDQALVFRFVHGDPNPGNLRLRRAGADVQVVQYDHGAMVELDAPQVRAICDLINGLRSGAAALPLLAAVGFDHQRLTRIGDDRITAVCRALAAPLLVEGGHDGSEWEPGAAIAHILGDDRWLLRAAGDPGLFGLTRAFGGLVRHLRILGASVAWADAWPGAAPSLVPLCRVAPVGPTDGDARRVHLQVVDEAGQERVALTLPLACLDDIGDLMDPALVADLMRQGQDVVALGRRVRAAGCPSGQICALQVTVPTGRRSIRIWVG